MRLEGCHEDLALPAHVLYECRNFLDVVGVQIGLNFVKEVKWRRVDGLESQHDANGDNRLLPWTQVLHPRLVIDLGSAYRSSLILAEIGCDFQTLVVPFVASSLSSSSVGAKLGVSHVLYQSDLGLSIRHNRLKDLLELFLEFDDTVGLDGLHALRAVVDKFPELDLAALEVPDFIIKLFELTKVLLKGLKVHLVLFSVLVLGGFQKSVEFTDESSVRLILERLEFLFVDFQARDLDVVLIDLTSGIQFLLVEFVQFFLELVDILFGFLGSVLDFQELLADHLEPGSVLGEFPL